MLFRFGAGSIKVSFGVISKIRCSNCNNIRPWELIRVSKHITMMSVPIPTETMNLVICPVCNYGAKLDDTEFEKYKKIAEGYAETWNIRGLELIKQGKNKSALENFEKAIELEPQNAESWFNKGNAIDDTGKHEDAIESYNRAIALQPFFPQAWYNKVSLSKA